jgi:FlaG/FlaF family flagellin (archaellin)
MVKTNWSEEAISPVIGIILIIAVVVLLGAVVGSVAFGTIGGTQGNSKSVHLTASKGSSGLTFTVQGGMDLPSVTSLDFVNGNTITNCTGASPKIGTTCSGVTDSTGRSVVVASFADGSKQIVFDKNWGARISGGDYFTVSITRSGPSSPYSLKLYCIPGANYNVPAEYPFYSDGEYMGSMSPSLMASYSDPSGTLFTTTDNPTNHWVVTAHMSDESEVTIYDQIV